MPEWLRVSLVAAGILGAIVVAVILKTEDEKSHAAAQAVSSPETYISQVSTEILNECRITTFYHEKLQTWMAFTRGNCPLVIPQQGTKR